MSRRKKYSKDKKKFNVGLFVVISFVSVLFGGSCFLYCYISNNGGDGSGVNFIFGDDNGDGIVTATPTNTEIESPNEELEPSLQVVATTGITINNTSSISSGFYINTQSADLSLGNLVLVNKTYYLSNDYVPSDLVTIDSVYNSGYYAQLRSVAKNAFVELCNGALIDGITIKNKSAYRSYSVQENLYNSYVAKDGVSAADTYSARPGYSEHQTGLALDVNQVSDSFVYTVEYQWMINNAYKYGFILRYPEGKSSITGYKFEPWHYRYVGVDVATYIQNAGITFDEYMNGL